MLSRWKTGPCPLLHALLYGWLDLNGPPVRFTLDCHSIRSAGWKGKTPFAQGGSGNLHLGLSLLIPADGAKGDRFVSALHAFLYGEPGCKRTSCPFYTRLPFDPICWMIPTQGGPHNLPAQQVLSLLIPAEQANDRFVSALHVLLYGEPGCKQTARSFYTRLPFDPLDGRGRPLSHKVDPIICIRLLSRGYLRCSRLRPVSAPQCREDRDTSLLFSMGQSYRKKT